MSAGLKPRAEKMIGETVNIFGVRATVVDAVPASDWAWEVTLSSINGGGEVEKWTIELPTDYHTSTGHFAWPTLFGKDDEDDD
jgi:hypothetical protein